MKLMIRYSLLFIGMAFFAISASDLYGQSFPHNESSKVVIYEKLYTSSPPSFGRDNTIWNDSLISEVKAFIDSHHTDSIVIQVHMDVRGSSELNLKLSQSIAEKVCQKFALLYPKIKFTPIGLGEQFPLIEYKLIKRERDRKMQDKLHDINSRIEFIIPK